MSILMPSMHTFSHYDPFNPAPFSPVVFDSQEHYLSHTASFASSPTSFAHPHPHAFPVDSRWYNTFTGHTSAAPHQFSPLTHSVITPPPLQTDQLSLSPSSTIAPIPPLSGGAHSHSRPSSMSNRIRSLTASGRSHRHPSPAHQRIARRSTVSSPAAPQPIHHAAVTTTTMTAGTTQCQSQAQSPVGAAAHPSPSSYLQSPVMEMDPDGLETRAAKRRRTDDVDSASLHSYSTIPELPQLLTPTQQPHLALIHSHSHGYAPAHTWAGPPSADHHPHGLSPEHHHHGYSQWPAAPLPYFAATAGGDHHHHHQHQHHQLSEHSLGVSDVVSHHHQHHHHHQLAYPSPTVVNPSTFFAAPASPTLEPPMSAVSTQFHLHKLEPESPRLFEDDEPVARPSFESFEHGPTEFPPRPYSGGVDAKSPWVPVKNVGKIFGSRLEQMPAIENRLAKLEDQLDRYLDARAAKSAKNAVLPGLELEDSPIDFAPYGPCRMFGGRIWPTALARRVRRTPRD